MKILMMWLMWVWCATGLAETEKQSGGDPELKQRDEVPPDYTVFVGKLQKQTYVDGVMPTECFEKVCMSSFYLYHIKVEDVVVGEPLKRRTQVARFQHAKYLFRSSQSALFVIAPVKNPSWERFLGTPYELVDFSQLSAEHCLEYPTNKYMSYLDEKEHCVGTSLLKAKGNLIAERLRFQLFNEVIDRVERQLNQQELLQSFDDSYYSDGRKALDTEDQEEACYDVDFDKHDKNPDCDFSKHYILLSYGVSKGLADQAKTLFQQELKASRLNLKPFDIRYRVIEHADHSEFQVHYKY
ncbi:hypothetical protein [Marinicella meishanensis]|uniref:hypothetical protein n=1 Tax=Marinicella meishanensis TaxID=2873263 RepID=UPI001CBD5154|nr:hypothetical protein [Marinicella sp. NBU2979]